MPVDTGLTDALLVKLYHLGKSDAEIAEEYEITVQAVNKRLNKMGLTRRTKPNRQVNEWLAYRWDIKASKVGGPDSHHQRYSAKRLKVWLRMRLGDDTLSDRQRLEAQQWERRIRTEGLVLCYDRDRPEGWYYRLRLPSDGRLVIDWPEGLPFPDERFKRALELPYEGADDVI